MHFSYLLSKIIYSCFCFQKCPCFCPCTDVRIYFFFFWSILIFKLVTTIYILGFEIFDNSMSIFSTHTFTASYNKVSTRSDVLMCSYHIILSIKLNILKLKTGHDELDRSWVWNRTYTVHVRQLWSSFCVEKHPLINLSKN